jgi:hypothetical protein
MKNTLLIITAVLLASCAQLGNFLSVTPNGDARIVYSDGSSTVFQTDETGKRVVMIISEWTNPDGVLLRAIYTKSTGEIEIEYRQDKDSGWILYSSKSGVSLAGAPVQSGVDTL